MQGKPEAKPAIAREGSVVTTHALDLFADGVACRKCGATDLEAAAELECCGANLWGVWCSNPKSPGWCENDGGSEWTSSRAGAEIEAARWRAVMADVANYSVRRYPSPASTAAAEAERWGVWCEKAGVHSVEWTGTEWRDIRKPPDVACLASALFATDERVRKIALDRGEYNAGESTHAGAAAADARYRAVIAKAWARGAEGKAPEAEWRAEAEVRAAGVMTELGRKP